MILNFKWFGMLNDWVQQMGNVKLQKGMCDAGAQPNLLYQNLMASAISIDILLGQTSIIFIRIKPLPMAWLWWCHAMICIGAAIGSSGVIESRTTVICGSNCIMQVQFVIVTPRDLNLCALYEYTSKPVHNKVAEGSMNWVRFEMWGDVA